VNVGSGVTLTLQETTCCICGGSTGAPCLEGYDIEFRTCDNKFTFLECAKCGHVFLSPRPRPDEMDRIYANYLTTNTASAYSPSPFIAWVKSNLFDRHRMRHVLGRLKDGSRVLDVGAGAGRLLRLIRDISDADLQLYANEIHFDDETGRSLREAGVHLVEGMIEHCEMPEKFDAITSIHTIEHVLDPRAVFEWKYEHLAPGGVLYLETPDANALSRSIFGNNWGHTHFPRHINLFSKKHLAGLAVDAGFEIVHHGNTTSAPSWNMSIRNALKMDALTRHKSVFEVFNYTNPFTLGMFTLLDLLLMTLRVPTSTQQLVARRPA
jgi:SAM-dependent methyltransferase